MYAREVQGKTLTFGVSGKLWEGSLVMYDSETKSLWSHLLGAAMSGELEGEVLEIIPSIITDWKTWKTEHPDTTALQMKRTASKFRRALFRKNRWSQWVLGYAMGQQSRHWNFRDLDNQTVINDHLADEQLLVLFDPKSSTALLYDRMVDDKPLTFERQKSGQLVDLQTGSLWNDLDGRAIAGKLKGTQLHRLPAIVSYLRPWEKFHPDTTPWSPE